MCVCMCRGLTRDVAEDVDELEVGRLDELVADKYRPWICVVVGLHPAWRRWRSLDGAHTRWWLKPWGRCARTFVHE